MKRSNVLQSLAVLFLFSQIAWGSVPQLINFQGILKDGSGNPVANSSYSVTFTIYEVPTGGTALWTETQSVSTSGGLFAVLLGSTNPVPDSVFKGSERWLGIAVSPDGEMLQRQQLVSVGYAYRVSSVDSALGGTIKTKVSIGPGHTNTGAHAFVAGQNNSATGDFTAIGGGGSNTASGLLSTVGGGGFNVVTNDYTTVSGGYRNGAANNGAPSAAGTKMLQVDFMHM